MPAIIEKIPDEQLITDYYDSKVDAATIEKLAPWADPTCSKPDYWQARLARNRAIMAVIEDEAAKRGLKL